jgi:MarR family transcriptional regulator, negative regulator of the multidrug operon emrRAB
MVMVQQQIEMVEASLKRLSARLDGVPVNQVLLIRMVLFLAHDFSQLMDQHIRPYGLAEGEFRVLMALFSQPENTAHPTDLCARSSQSPANMSRICDALVTRDLITRDLSAQDRRKMVLRTTPKGDQLVRDLLPAMFSGLRQVFSEFEAGDQETLIALLKRLAIRLDDVMADGAVEKAL